MAQLITPAKAVAYINEGRWVADCPQPGCACAEKLTPGQFVYSCGDPSCLAMAEVTWPPALEAHNVWAVLQERPNLAVRNWYPEGHPTAVRYGLPHGETAAELAEETSRELAREAAEHGRVKIAAEREQRFAAQASEVRAARKALRERWNDEGHGLGGPAFHPGSDEDGFPPEHTITRGEGQAVPKCLCSECKPKGGK